MFSSFTKACTLVIALSELTHKPFSPPCLVQVKIWCAVTTVLTMGVKPSKTPLTCMMDHFQEAFHIPGEGYGVQMSCRKLCTFCDIDWPSFNVGWPSGDSLDPQVALAIWNVVSGKPGHPDQFPYNDQ